MPTRLSIRREISFTPRSSRLEVDVVPIGFELYTKFVSLEESFFDYNSLTAALVLLCLTDTVFVDEADEETPIEALRPFLLAHYDSIKSQPLSWVAPEDVYEPTLQFGVTVHQATKDIPDRIELLGRFVQEVSGNEPPIWYGAFKTDCERRVPAYYYFDLVYDEDACFFQFDWSTWKKGRSFIRKVKRSCLSTHR